MNSYSGSYGKNSNRVQFFQTINVIDQPEIDTAVVACMVELDIHKNE